MSSSRESRIDWWTMVLYFTLVLIGWFNIYSTGLEDHPKVFDITSFHGKQLLFIGTSLLFGGLILLMDTKFLEFISYFLYGSSLVLLIGVLIMAKATNGSLSWFELGGFKIQPTEFAKVGTLLALAKYMSRYNFSMDNRRDLTLAVSIVAVPMALVLLQNDPGSALVFGSLLFVFYREGLSTLIIGLIFLLGIVAVASIMMVKVKFYPYIILGTLLILSLFSFFYIFRRRFGVPHLLVFILLGAIPFVVNKPIKPHHSARLRVLITDKEKLNGLRTEYLEAKKNTHLSPEQVKAVEKEYVSMRQAYFQLRHSLVAIGSGGLTGKGYGKSTHTRGDFVPEEHTDYIFCVVGEEYGFAGTIFVMILYMLLLIRIIHMAENSKTTYARVYGYGAASVVACHVFVNIGMTIGLVPTVGIPLVFISYGGSAMIGFSVMMFFLMNHYNYRHNLLRKD